MASKSKIQQQKSVNSRRKTLLRDRSLAKDEEMEKILEEIDNRNKYSPSTKNSKKRQPIESGGGVPPEEELDELFVDVEERNAELQELLQAVESCRDSESEGQRSRITSAETRRSTDTLVEKLLDDLDGVGFEKDQFPNYGPTEKANGFTTNTKPCSAKLKASASEEELDHMLAELLEL